MPQTPAEDNGRMSLRIPADAKALLMRGAALRNTTLTDFVLRTSVDAARHVIEEAERLQLSERDSALVLELLDNPPKPNAKLLAAARALPEGP